MTSNTPIDAVPILLGAYDAPSACTRTTIFKALDDVIATPERAGLPRTTCTSLAEQQHDAEGSQRRPDDMEYLWILIRATSKTLSEAVNDAIAISGAA
ncbi:hypothetical protein FRC05_003188 [Tulasnella sp. 425]|nr:hypothetical protein FRC05_003188 [Tulasnella sp. 425]